VGGGRYGRVFIGTNQGWYAGTGQVPTVEEVVDHLDEIRDISQPVVPLSNNDEIMLLGRMIAG
jgi:hypothetical protein